MTELPLVHSPLALGCKVAWAKTSIVHLEVACVPFRGGGKSGRPVVVHFVVPLALRFGTH